MISSGYHVTQPEEYSVGRGGGSTTRDLTIYHNIRARAEKGNASSSAIWTLIDDSKLANQIARSVAIVVDIVIAYCGPRLLSRSIVNSSQFPP